MTTKNCGAGLYFINQWGYWIPKREGGPTVPTPRNANLGGGGGKGWLGFSSPALGDSSRLSTRNYLMVVFLLLFLQFCWTYNEQTPPCHRRSGPSGLSQHVLSLGRSLSGFWGQFYHTRRENENTKDNKQKLSIRPWGFFSRPWSPCNDSIKHDKHRQRKPEEERDDREEVDLAVGHHGINHGLTTDCGAKSNDFVPDEKPSSKLDQHQLCKSGSLDLPCSWQLPTWKGIWTPHCRPVDRDFNYLYKPMRDDGFWHSQWRGQDHRKKPWDETNLKIEFFMYISFSHEVESLIFQFSNSYEKNSHQSCLSFCPDPSSM